MKYLLILLLALCCSPAFAVPTVTQPPKCACGACQCKGCDCPIKDKAGNVVYRGKSPYAWPQRGPIRWTGTAGRWILGLPGRSPW